MPRFVAATVAEPGGQERLLAAGQPRTQRRRRFRWWTRERVLAGLRDYHAAYGKAPTSSPAWDRLPQARVRLPSGRRRYPGGPQILQYFPTMRQAWIAAGVPLSRQRDLWLPADLAFLRRWWGIKPDRWVADRLGRTVVACTLAAKRRLNHKRRDNFLTMRAVALVFGVDAKTPLRWAERGWLGPPVKAPYRQGLHEVWMFCADCVRRFVETMGWAYDWRRMPPGHELTDLAREVNERDPWLTIAEFHARYGKSGTFTDTWRARGLLRFKYRPKQQHAGDPLGLIVIREADIPVALARIAAVKHQEASARAVERVRRHGLPNGRFPKEQKEPAA